MWSSTLEHTLEYPIVLSYIVIIKTLKMLGSLGNPRSSNGLNVQDH